MKSFNYASTFCVFLRFFCGRLIVRGAWGSCDRHIQATYDIADSVRQLELAISLAIFRAT